MINSPALFKKIDENTTRVFFSNQVGLNGMVPQMIVNSKAEGGPRDFFTKVHRPYERLKSVIQEKK